MRRSVILVTVFGAISLLIGVASANIKGTHHDWSGSSVTGFETCRLCHTPHNADQTVPDSPLWNHEVTVATFTPYASTSMDSSPGQPTGVSKLCLSCHDGTVAVTSFGGVTGTRHIIDGAKTGTDLRSHHPIAFVYDASLAATDGELWDPSTTPSGLGGTIAEDLLGPGGNLECSSCHDVHVGRKAGEGCSGCHGSHGGGPWGFANYPNTLSLWKSNQGSELCLTCHKK